MPERKTVGQLMEEMRLKAGAQNYHGHEYMDLERFAEDTRHTLLNIDGKGHAQPETVVAKSARPSVLDSLKRPVLPRSPEKKPKQHEEVR